MSIIEKPFVFPSRAIEGTDPVNISKMVTFRKFDEMSRLGNKRSSYSIIWQSSEFAVGATASEIEWTYPDKECRDLDYRDIRAQFGTGVIGSGQTN